MRYNQLVEGMRYGQKQKNEILSSLDDFGFGIEIEMNSKGIAPDPDNIDEGTFDPEFLDLMKEYIVANPTVNLPSKDEDNDALSVFQKWAKNQYFNEDESNSSLVESVAINLRTARQIYQMLYDTKTQIGSDTTKNNKMLIDLFNELVEIAPEIDEYGYTDRGSYTPLIAHAITQQVADHDADGDLDTDGLQDIGENLSYVMGRMDALLNMSGDVVELKGKNDEDIGMYMEDFVLGKVTSRFIWVFDIFLEALDRYDYTLTDTMDAEVDMGRLIDEIVREVVVNEGADLEDCIRTVLGMSTDDVEGFEDLVEELIDADPVWFYHEIPEPHELDSKIDSDDMTDLLYNMDLSFQYTIEDESDGQIEIITETPHKGKEIIQAFDEAYHIMGELTSSHDMYTASNSGLHISISYMDGAYHFDPIKFTVLSNMLNMVDDEDHVRGYVQSIFSFVERNVEYIARQITDSVVAHSATPDLGNFIMEYVRDSLSDKNPWKHGSPKFKSINFEHYHSQNGRVELRVFGGEGFENKKEEYFDEMIRAMYTLKISTTNDSGTAYMDKEFKKMMFRIADKYFNQKYKMSISDYQDTVKLNFRILDKLKISVSDDIRDIVTDLLSDAAEQNITIKEVDILTTFTDHLPGGQMIDMLHKQYMTDALKAIYILKRKLK